MVITGLGLGAPRNPSAPLIHKVSVRKLLIHIGQNKFIFLYSGDVL